MAVDWRGLGRKCGGGRKEQAEGEDTALRAPRVTGAEDKRRWHSWLRGGAGEGASSRRHCLTAVHDLGWGHRHQIYERAICAPRCRVSHEGDQRVSLATDCWGRRQWWRQHQAKEGWVELG
ncbi:hypothetical protein NDU88_005648 [Pleurodeles waltl]|uniref:Uncharacterized protein n=1 Tax=Pleurodeles waltl TaxID=8319 RepID=A0AAV7LSN5_PLEWA|nr:hypothetical protein NDU88_005648 [Pleurodeles waltl]